jgi:threonine aldolase
MGKEAALFVASGTMGNLCAVLAHCQKGAAIILDSKSHIFSDEAAGLAAIAGCLARTLDCPDGSYRPQDLRDAISTGSLTVARTGLVCLENTHNRRGGLPVPVEKVKQTADVAHGCRLPVHLDGARIFNAAIAMGINVAEITRHVDSAQFCLSKGLGCPIGSVLVGERDFIAQAKAFRRMLGGGMRQVGVIAAAGRVALAEMIDRLAEDHRRAQELAVGLAEIPGLEVDLSRPRTNMVYITLGDRDKLDAVIAGLCGLGVNVGSPGPGQIRLVTHCDIADVDVNRTVLAFRDVMKTVHEA